MEEEQKIDEVLDDFEEDEVVEEPEMAEVEEAEFGDFSDQIKFDVELEEADKDKIFVIENVELKKPQLRDALGNKIPPKALSGNENPKLGYTTKVVATFKDTNYAAIIPSVKWYPNIVEVEGKKKTIYNPWFNTNVKKEQLTDPQTSEISKLFYKYCDVKNLDMKRVTQKQFYEGLKGMKVKLEQKKGTFKGRDWSKIVIVEFVK